MPLGLSVIGFRFKFDIGIPVVTDVKIVSVHLAVIVSVKLLVVP